MPATPKEFYSALRALLKAHEPESRSLTRSLWGNRPCKNLQKLDSWGQLDLNVEVSILLGSAQERVFPISLRYSILENVEQVLP